MPHVAQPDSPPQVPHRPVRQQPVPHEVQGFEPQESHAVTGAAQDGRGAQEQSSARAALIDAADDDASNIAKAVSRRIRKLRKLSWLS